MIVPQRTVAQDSDHTVGLHWDVFFHAERHINQTRVPGVDYHFFHPANLRAARVVHRRAGLQTRGVGEFGMKFPVRLRESASEGEYRDDQQPRGDQNKYSDKNWFSFGWHRFCSSPLPVTSP